MPSPVGHALGAVAIGWQIVPRPQWRAAAVLALVAIAPDLDLLVHDHRGMSHSLGVAVLAGLVAWAITRSPRWALAVALAWASHVALDWLSNDTRPPIGVMALWPFSQTYSESSLHLFLAISRRYWLPEFWVYNLRALAREILILGPVVAVVYGVRRRSIDRRR